MDTRNDTSTVAANKGSSTEINKKYLVPMSKIVDDYNTGYGVFEAELGFEDTTTLYVPSETHPTTIRVASAQEIMQLIGSGKLAEIAGEPITREQLESVNALVYIATQQDKEVGHMIARFGVVDGKGIFFVNRLTGPLDARIHLIKFARSTYTTVALKSTVIDLHSVAPLGFRPVVSPIRVVCVPNPTQIVFPRPSKTGAVSTPPPTSECVDIIDYVRRNEDSVGVHQDEVHPALLRHVYRAHTLGYLTFSRGFYSLAPYLNPSAEYRFVAKRTPKGILYGATHEETGESHELLVERGSSMVLRVDTPVALIKTIVHHSQSPISAVVDIDAFLTLTKLGFQPVDTIHLRCSKGA